MIELRELSKRYAGHVAVDRLSLDVAEGEIAVLIGPSGCGKTTTMRMINRMIEPDAGSIRVAGRDARTADPIALRRSIGYVIQQVGLFPHMTIGENVATVPRLLGWDARRVARRVDEMLALVAMEPATYRDRFPRELSGGQRQRVGVARALAADPPVMLMDEPFGALDPITRAKLQDEFLRILRELRKTIVFVTHDIEEAIRMGDRIAILRAGRLVQYAPPESILAHPADAFVEEFVGSDRALKRLSLLDAIAFAERATAAGPRRARRGLTSRATMRDALTTLLVEDADAVAIVDERGVDQGVVTLASVRAALRDAVPASAGEGISAVTRW